MAITSEMVKSLREATGLPMMECKKALEECGGDQAKAMDLLRKKGLAQLTKRAERVTAEGRLSHAESPGRHSLVELLCETEPVAKTDEFLHLARAAAQAAVRLDDPTPESVLAQPAEGDRTVNDLLHDAVNRIRENIRIGRVATFKGHVGCYVHHDGRKGVLVEFNAAPPAEAAADVCMHITAMRPLYTRREEVDPKLVEEKRQLAQQEVQGKPPAIVDKIVAGKLDRWYSDFVLLEQPFVKDDKVSVGQHLKQINPQLTVQRFTRIEIGEA